MTRRASPPLPSVPRPVLGVAALLLLAVVLGFSGIVDNGFVSYDDDAYLVANPIVARGLSVTGAIWAFTTFHAANWHPLTWLSHMLDASLFGLAPAGHHAMGALLHALNALALFVLLRALTGALWKSALVAALFAVHPLHVESVAWASERKDVLSSLLALLAALAWVRHLRLPGRREWYLAACALFALALMAKPMPVTLPFVLLLLDWWPLGRWSPLGAPAGAPRAPLPPWPLWREKAPLLLLAAASSAITFVAQRAGGAVAPTEIVPFLFRAANALLSYLRYLAKAAWPSDLSFYTPLPAVLGVWVGPAAALALAAATWLAVRSSRRRPWLAVGWLWYLGSLVPVIGLVQVGGQAVADRYTYLTLSGIFLIAAWSLAELAAARPAARRAIALGTCLCLGVLLARTRQQVAVWHDDIPLAAQALALSRENWMAQSLMGISLVKSGRPAEGLPYLREALRINPNAPEVRFNVGATLEAMGELDAARPFYEEAIQIRPEFTDARSNLGNLLMKQGKIDEALPHFREVVRLNPIHPQGRYNLATALAAKGEAAEAEEHFLAALEYVPDRMDALNSLGNLLASQGRYDEALGVYRRILEARPADVPALNNLGNALFKLGRTDEAIAAYTEALARDPAAADTHFNLGNLYSAGRRIEEATREYTLFLAARPDHARGHFHLGNTLAAQRRFPEAIERYRRALELEPGLADAEFNLGNALADSGRPAEAIEHYARAAQLSPGDPAIPSRLGDSFARTGRRDDAVAAYRAALAIDPAFADAASGLGRLGERPGAPTPRTPAAP